MPNFPKNKGFKLPGMGSKEIDTPGNFRKDQKVEDVGYCSDTESHMLPKGSSPLLATDSDLHDTSWLVPRADKPSYTGSRAAKPWPTKKKGGEGEDLEGTAKINTPEYTPPEIKGNLDFTDLPGTGEMPNLVQEGKKRDTMIIQEKGEERRGSTKFKPGTDVDKAKQYISDYKAKILKANPDFTPDQVTQKYRSDHNIGKVTTTPGKTIEFSGLDLKKKIL